MKKQYDFSKMRVKRRGALLERTTKVQKTVRLDLDVLGWLVQEGLRRGIPYQTLLNSVLKEAMLRAEAPEGDLHRLIRSVVRAELKKAS